MPDIPELMAPRGKSNLRPVHLNPERWPRSRSRLRCQYPPSRQPRAKGWGSHDFRHGTTAPWGIQKLPDRWIIKHWRLSAMWKWAAK